MDKNNKNNNYEYDNLDDYIRNMNKLDFPYKKYYTNDIDLMFERLKGYNVKERIVHKPYKLRNINILPKQMLFRNDYWIIETRESDYLDWNILSDMFNEHCRMECRLIKTNPSPSEYWQRNKKYVGELALRTYGKITPYTLRETIYKNSKECTSHRPNNMMAMLQIFNKKSVLDISSGWGDRLLGALAMGVDYLGVDPNNCLHKGYNEIIRRFKGDGVNAQVIEGEFEKIDFKALYAENKIKSIEFDLVYTSPPYFDLEIYTDTSPQSSNYGGENEWFEQFLKPALKTAWSMLKDDGVMAININQKQGETYVNRMIDFVDEFDDAIYLGLIAYANEQAANPQPIWCWKKNVQYKKYKNLYLQNKKKLN